MKTANRRITHRKAFDSPPPPLPPTEPGGFRPTGRGTISIGARLRQLRKQYRLTVDQLAELTGYAVTTLENAERNARDPSLQLCRDLAAFYGLSLAELL